MNAPSKLQAWREAHGLTRRHAARVLRISVDLYEEFERGEGECGPALALDIAQRTQFAVMPGDLPGCAIETGSDTAKSSGDCCAAVTEGAAAQDRRSVPPIDAAPKTSARVGEDGRADAGGGTGMPSPPAIERFGVDRGHYADYVSLQIFEAMYVVALAPNEAIALGLRLIASGAKLP